MSLILATYKDKSSNNFIRLEIILHISNYQVFKKNTYICIVLFFISILIPVLYILLDWRINSLNIQKQVFSPNNLLPYENILQTDFSLSFYRPYNAYSMGFCYFGMVPINNQYPIRKIPHSLILLHIYMGNLVILNRSLSTVTQTTLLSINV